MKSLTTLQIEQLDRVNVASQRAGGLGTLLYGQLVLPDAGSLGIMSPLRYRSTPAVGTATYAHAAITLTASTQTVTTGTTNPDFPRILTVKGNASGNAGNVVLTGTNFNDEVITETIALNGSSEVLGTKAFKTLTSIALPAETHAGTDTVSIGVGNKFGFPAVISNTGLVFAKNFNGSVDAGTVTASTTVEGSIYAVAGTPDGAKYLDLYFFA